MPVPKTLKLPKAVTAKLLPNTISIRRLEARWLLARAVAVAERVAGGKENTLTLDAVIADLGL
jgi:hypothetical protein